MRDSVGADVLEYFLPLGHRFSVAKQISGNIGTYVSSDTEGELPKVHYTSSTVRARTN